MKPGENKLETPTFCYSCGLAKPQLPICECGAPVETPSWTPSLVGSVLRIKSLFSTKTGVVTSEGAESSLLVGPGKTVVVKHRRLERADRIVDMAGVPSEFFRFHTIAEGDETWALGLRQWLADPKTAEAWLTDWNSRRLFARSAVAAGQLSLAEKTDLSVSELLWLQMHTAGASGDAKLAATIALQLPPDRYPDKVQVVLSGLVKHLWSPSSSDLESLNQWALSMNGVKTLRAAAGLELSLEEWAEVLDSVSDSPQFDRQWIELMLTGRAGQKISDRDRACAMEVANDTARSVSDRRFALSERLVAARFGLPTQLSGTDVAKIGDTAPEVLDDLIDAELVTLDGDSQGVPPRVLARVAPEHLSDEALESLDHPWERARRVFLSDGKGKWPDGPAGAHYQALANLKRGDTASIGAIQDPSGTARAVVTSLRSGSLDPLVLSDPTTWDVVESAAEAPEIESEAAAEWNLRKALAAVLEWDWDRAGDHAMSALRRSKDEVVRDEALNIIGFVRYQKGDDEAALTALERALDGEYTASLQANAGIVAEHLVPERAAYHLGKLASEAPNMELKLAAVRHAFRIWGSSKLAWEGDEDSMSVPSELIGALRELCVADIGLDDFGEVVRLLSNFDAEWVAAKSNTEGSPHRDSWERQVFVAKAGGDPAEYIEAVAKGLKAEYHADWLVEERDRMVDGLRALIFEDIEHLGPATYAFIAIDKGLPMKTWDRVVLTCGSLVAISSSLISEENLPSDQLIGMYDEVKRALSELDDEQRDTVQTLVDAAGNSLAQAIGVGCESMLNQGFQALNTLTVQLSGVPMRNINWTKVTAALRPIRDMADETGRYLGKAQSYAVDGPLVDALKAMIETSSELRGIAANPRSIFR